MFYDWLIKNHENKNTPRGDLARDVKRDRDFPKDEDDYEKILRHFMRKGACIEAIDTFKKAYKSYQKTKKDVKA